MRFEQNLLLFSLRKKSEKLQKIKEITIWQGENEKPEQFVSGVRQERVEYWRKQKQELINEIKRLDEGFESMLPKVLPELQAKVVENKEMILEFQSHIADIQQLEEEITKLEKQNYNQAKLRNLQKEIKDKGILPRKEAAKMYRNTKKK